MCGFNVIMFSETNVCVHVFLCMYEIHMYMQKYECKNIYAMSENIYIHIHWFILLLLLND
jgi:hypothetical protein